MKDYAIECGICELFIGFFSNIDDVRRITKTINCPKCNSQKWEIFAEDEHGSCELIEEEQ